MTSPTIKLAAVSERFEWDSYVGAHPDATYCHRWAWREAFEAAYGKRCYYLFATDEGAWSGLLPLVHMKGRLSGNCLVSLPFLDQGGILASSENARSHLLEAAFGLLEEIRAERLDLRAEPFDSVDFPDTTERFRFVLPLGGCEDELWSTIGPKVRNQIRKSEREGLETSPVGVEDLARFYDVFGRNMRDLGSPVHSERLFRQVLSRFGPDAQLYLTIDAAGSTVAGGVSIRFRDSVVVPWASSLFSARPKCPNHSFYWRVLRDSLERGSRWFDFGRSSLGSGTYRFKKQWNARQVPLFWTSYDEQQRVLRGESHLSASRNPRLAALWSHLPVRLANRLGPLIRAQLPN